MKGFSFLCFLLFLSLSSCKVSDTCHTHLRSEVRLQVKSKKVIVREVIPSNPNFHYPYRYQNKSVGKKACVKIN